MPELVEEHHDGQDEQERDDRSRSNRRPRSSDPPRKSIPGPRPPRTAIQPQKLLKCLCGDFGQELARQRSRIMVNGESPPRWSRARASRRARAAAPSVASTSAGIPAKPSLPSRNSATATSLAAFRTVVRARRRAARAGPGPAPGSAPDRAPRRSACRPRARSSRVAGPSMRSGQARQCAIGTRMSGGPRCATTEPSRNSTSPWTIDWGWTRTSISSGVQSEKMMRLDHFKALVHQGRGIDRDLRPHRPIRMLERRLRASPCGSRPSTRCGTDRPRR